MHVVQIVHCYIKAAVTSDCFQSWKNDVARQPGAQNLHLIWQQMGTEPAIKRVLASV